MIIFEHYNTNILHEVAIVNYICVSRVTKSLDAKIK